MAEQGQNDDNQIGRLLETVQWGVLGGGESPAAGGAAVAPLGATVDADQVFKI
jgi:hypothetical protein